MKERSTFAAPFDPTAEKADSRLSRPFGPCAFSRGFAEARVGKISRLSKCLRAMIVQENFTNRYLETAKLSRRASLNLGLRSRRRAVVTLAEKGNKEGGALIHQSSHDAGP